MKKGTKMKNMIMLILLLGYTVCWAQEGIEVSTAPKEPYTKKQELVYSETPTDAAINWRGVMIGVKAPSNEVFFAVQLIALKGDVNIPFVVDGEKIGNITVVVSETELNDVLKLMGYKPDFTDALTKAAVAKLPK